MLPPWPVSADGGPGVALSGSRPACRALQPACPAPHHSSPAPRSADRTHVLELGSTATVADVKAAIEARQGEPPNGGGTPLGAAAQLVQPCAAAAPRQSYFRKRTAF